jgi:hypothetical protein
MILKIPLCAKKEEYTCFNVVLEIPGSGTFSSPLVSDVVSGKKCCLGGMVP